MAEGQTRIQFFSSPGTRLFIAVESSSIRSWSKGRQMGQVVRLGTKGPLAGSLGCRQVMWNKWPQFNLCTLFHRVNGVGWHTLVDHNTPNDPVHDRRMSNPLAKNVGPLWHPRKENNTADRLRYVDNV